MGPRPKNDVPPHNRYAAMAVCGLLLLAVGLIYGQTIQHNFVNYVSRWR